jgi:Ca2+-binding RTX toxin-like protein
VGFFASDDGTFDSGTDTPIGSEFVVSAERIQNSNGALVLFNDSGAAELPEAALAAGKHVLVIDVAALVDAGDATFTALEQALLNQNVEIILAVADPDSALDETDETDNDIDFRGFYQRDSSQRAVIRTGFGTDDNVEVESDGLRLTLDDGQARTSVTLTDAADILVVTSSGTDFVSVASEVAISVIAELGDGNDFAVGGAGDDEFHGGQGIDILLGEGFGASLTGPDLKTFLDALAQGQIVLGNVTLSPVGSGSDMLFGDEGFDVLFGGGGSDMLQAGDGGSIVFADAFTVSGSLNFDFGEFLNAPGLESAQNLLTQGLMFEAAIGLPGDGSNSNEVSGGDGFDLLFGSKGRDNMTGGGGVVDVVLGFAGADTIDADGTDSLIAFGGDGNDVITGGAEVNILVGGSGDDMVTGGEQTDVIIGDSFTFGVNGEDGFSKFLTDLRLGTLSFKIALEASGSGNDTLTGLGSFDVLIGGDGTDTLEGGEGGGLLFGDAFNLTIGPNALGFDTIFDGTDESGNPGNDNQQTQDRKKTKARSLFSRFLTLLGTPQFTLTGTGNDVVNGGSGIDLIVGGEGNDTAVGGGGFVDILIGNEGNDTLTAHQSFFSIMFGGADNDRLEAATIPGSLGSILFGDGFRFLGAPVNPASVFTIDFNGLLPVTFGIATGLVQDGNGADTLVGAQGGFNLMLGGGGNDTLTGAGLVDFMLGDSLNLGAEILIDFSNLSFANGPEENFDAINTSFQLPGLAASGDDVIRQSGDGFTVAIGGDGADVIDGGNGTLEILFGNRGGDTIRGNAGFNVIVGGEDSDTLTGGNDGNVILGDTFNFNVPGRINFDVIRNGRIDSPLGLIPSGEGNDSITGGDGLDVIIGGSGNDSISGGNGFNAVLTDTITIGGDPFSFVDTFSDVLKSAIFGDANAVLNSTLAALGLSGVGNDTYTGGSGIDIVFGGDGNDRIDGGAGFDFLVGGNGDDTVDGMTDDDVVFGGPGDDDLTGGAGNDRLESEGGDDIFRGGADNDSIFGGDGNDQLFGEGGDDELNGENGEDLLDGGDANDVLRGGADNDRLVGGNGDDLLDGGDSDDLLFGGPGNDRLIGGRGDDLLQGEDGSDTLVNPSVTESVAGSPVQVDLRVVLSATPTDVDGHVAELPTDVDFLDEWDDFFVEVWGSTPRDGTSSLSTFSVNLRFDTNLFSASGAGFGAGFSLSQASTVDDAEGIVGLSAATAVSDAGRDEFVLLGRVAFVPMAVDDLPNNLPGAYILPSLGTRFVTTDVATTTTAGVGADTTLVVTVPEIWPVMYDLDDSGTISFGDVTLFAEAFGSSVSGSGSAFGSDFDRNGVVGFGDVSFFASNFGRNRTESDRQTYAANFPVAWRPDNAVRLFATGFGSGPASNAALAIPDIAELQSLTDAAVKLLVAGGLDEAAAGRLRTVESAVSDLPMGVLGLADGNRIVIDVDASGVGWFVDKSPLNHSEFGLTDDVRYALAPPAFGRVDLLSVIVHELGHIIGLHHTDDGFMQGTLASGERRLPALREIDAHFATFHHLDDLTEIE